MLDSNQCACPTKSRPRQPRTCKESPTLLPCRFSSASLNRRPAASVSIRSRSEGTSCRDRVGSASLAWASRLRSKTRVSPRTLIRVTPDILSNCTRTVSPPAIRGSSRWRPALSWTYRIPSCLRSGPGQSIKKRTSSTRPAVFAAAAHPADQFLRQQREGKAEWKSESGHHGDTNPRGVSGLGRGDNGCSGGHKAGSHSPGRAEDHRHERPDSRAA
jgi:hypothetical protein